MQLKDVSIAVNTISLDVWKSLVSSRLLVFLSLIMSPLLLLTAFRFSLLTSSHMNAYIKLEALYFSLSLCCVVINAFEKVSSCWVEIAIAILLTSINFVQFHSYVTLL